MCKRKKKSWLTEQFRIARKEVQSWSPAKQAMMKNALRARGKKR